MSDDKTPETGGAATPRGRILVIDDSELVLDISRDALEEAGYEVVTNSSWVEVSATIRERRPDLILLDLMMPSIRGESLCEILKKSSFGRDIPIIIFSTKDESEIQRLVEEAGADGYIVKRLNRKDIVDGVDHYFERLVRGHEPSST
jgi:CheY-like chemotaxis protein